MKSIAIDGPSGAGKSTLAKTIAKKIGFLYVDTGAIYRCIGLFALQNNISSKDEDKVCALLKDIQIKMFYDADGLQHMVLNNEDVTEKIRLPQVSIYASDVSAMPSVRAFLLDMQREIAQTQNVIMDGRDIGTVVLPNADLKIFLTASAEDRAKRRFNELLAKGMDVTYEAVLKDMRYRDQNDSTRDIAPLKAADDAVIVDTSGNTVQESVVKLLEIIKERLSK